MVLFRERYGFDISYISSVVTERWGVFVCKNPNKRRGVYSRAAPIRVAVLNQSFTVSVPLQPST